MKYGFRNIIYCTLAYDPAIPSGANRRARELCTRFDRQFGAAFELIIAKGKRPPGLTRAMVHEIDYKPKSILGRLSAKRQIGHILRCHSPAIFVNEFLPIPFRSIKEHLHFQVVYDLRYFTDNQTLRQRLMYTLPIKAQWSRSERLVACSEFTKHELVRLCGCRPENILISNFAIDGKLLQQPEWEPRKDIDILFVGHFEKRKNHANLLRALAIVDKGLRVEFIGVDNGLKTELELLARQLGISNVQFLTLNDDQTLWDYYRRARLFVFPSNYEGFGIPLIESLALGTPVACSDIPVFREIGGNLVDYFNQHDPEHMADVISKALHNPRTPSRRELHDVLCRYLWDSIYESFVHDLLAVSAPA
ncbi:MAG: glycosyltransferase family 4 protein [Acidobacteria bacterium]|nr:glycosyltransferase family 4 protein [Acidobacteriota bacterium]